jgi:hypothetical protein
MITNLINGIKSEISSLISTVQNIAGQIAKYLHFSVPDEGPLSDFDKTPGDMIDMLANGLKNGVGTIKFAAGTVAQSLSDGLGFGSMAASSYALAGSGGGQIVNITINASGNVTKNEKELGDRIQEQIWEKIKKQGKL